MKLQTPENESYAATVVKLKSFVPLEANEKEGKQACDNVVGTIVYGFQAIVSKDGYKEGDLGLFFPAGTQLSEEYARMNNLHRHGNLNNDEGAKGYFEDNRRVKAMKFRGHRTDCLFMPLSSLSYLGIDVSELKEGDTFDRLGDHEICNKYLIRKPKREQRLEKNKDQFVRVDKKFLPEHYDSDQWYKHHQDIPDEATVIVTQKLHGTSIRVGNTVVARKLTLRDRLAKLIGVEVAPTEFDYVFGSRKVIKDIHNPNQNHFYSTDIWTEEGRKIEHLIPENFLIYAELIGWDSQGVPIQPNYTYQVPHQTCDLYVYRVAIVNGQGIVTDLSWDQVREFCEDRGLRTVPELWRGKKKDLPDENMTAWFIDKRFRDEGYVQAVPLDEESPVDEGVCVRVDGLAPYILKAKGPQFYGYEEFVNESEGRDLEAEGSEV